MTRWLLGGVALALLCYAALCAWMYANQRRLVHYPQFTRVPAAATDFRLQRGDATLRGWVVNPGRPHALVYFGGNGESVEVNRELFARASRLHRVPRGLSWLWRERWHAVATRFAV